MENKQRLVGWNVEMVNTDKAGEVRGQSYGCHAKNPGGHEKA